jgi:multidrug efflux system outer membrane protein
MKMRVLPLTLSLVLLGGCSLMPDYQRPDVTTINGWERSEQSAAAAADTHWQALFADPALTRVIRLGLDHNPDLRSALLNVERYRAQYRIQRADLLPTLALDGSGTRQRVPDELSQSGEATISSQYSATVGLTAWELDLFGRVRSLKEQALQTYLAQEQTRRSVQLTLVASIANAYLDWVADREQLTLAQQTRQIEADNLALVRKRYELGVASELELAQAEAALEDAEVTLSRYRRLTALDRNALTLLVGTPLPADWQPSATLADTRIADVSPGLPSELLTRRPDILAAEHQLRAANASIGAARAAFFPSISLTANAGSLSGELDNLFASGSGTWLFSPSISLPIFSGGRLSAQLDVAEVDRDLALTQYEQAIQNAFTDVANALANRDGYVDQLASQERAMSAYQRYFSIADQRYRNGIDSMLTRLDAQRNLVASQQATIDARLALAQAKVDLYRALGGGWQADDTGAEATETP